MSGISITGQLTGILAGTLTIGPFTVTPGSAVDSQQLINVTTTYTAYTPPTGFTGCILIPPSTNTIVPRIAGPAASAGTILLHKTNPTLLTLDTTSTGFGLDTAAGTVTGLVILWF